MLLSRFLVASLLLALAGCTVYAPMQPTTPLVRQRGQADAGASLQPLGRLEVTGAYSPVRRLVLAGGLTAAPRLGQEVYLVTAQYEARVGLYQPANRNLLPAFFASLGLVYHLGATSP